VPAVRVGWTGTLDPRPLVRVDAWGPEAMAEAVRAHAEQHIADGTWVEQGSMSPRITPPKGADAWDALAIERRGVLDRLVAEQAMLDLRLIGALGEPAYWRFDDQGRRQRPDDGASRYEMQPRNSGATFVRNRLRKLADAVAGRDAQAILDGLTGETVVDEAGSGAPDSRTATGLAGPGPIDNALAWCAMWGISQFPVVHLVERRSRTAAHLDGPRGAGPRHGWFCLAVPAAPMSLPRLRTVNASRHVTEVVAQASDEASPAEAGIAAEASAAWLLGHGVAAVVRFPVEEFGSGNASERRALTGTVMGLRRGAVFA
jgi:CRISPR-associated protein Csb3